MSQWTMIKENKVASWYSRDQFSQKYNTGIDMYTSSHNVYMLMQN